MNLLAYAVVSDQTDNAVGLFVRRERAEQFLEAVRADEPELAERLHIEPVEPIRRRAVWPFLRGAVPTRGDS